MKVSIIGSREFNDYNLLYKTLIPVKDKISLIISGGARGADSLAERFAKENNIPTQVFIPDWDQYGKRAGYLRNKEIVESSDVVIAFWNGISPGTKHLIDLAQKLNKPLKIIAV